jgi:hypothetical protein
VQKLAARFLFAPQPTTATVGPKGVSERFLDALAQSKARDTVH